METVKRKLHLMLKCFVLALLLAETVCLTGCTGKELEQRRFPLALAVDSVQDQIVLSCAWPGEEGGETGELGGGKPEAVEEAESEEEKPEGGEEAEPEKEKPEGGGELEPEEEKPEGGEELESEEEKPEGGGELEPEEEKPEAVEELEEQRVLRNTDTITQVSGSTIQEAVEAVQNLQDKYVDYSQVKAILWGPGLEKNPEQAQQVKDWLEKTPAFARNLLIFDEKKAGLDLETVQEQSKGQAGAYLENIYENQRPYRNTACMLQDLLYGEG